MERNLSNLLRINGWRSLWEVTKSITGNWNQDWGIAWHYPRDSLYYHLIVRGSNKLSWALAPRIWFFCKSRIMHFKNKIKKFIYLNTIILTGFSLYLYLKTFHEPKIGQNIVGLIGKRMLLKLWHDEHSIFPAWIIKTFMT